MDAEYDSFVGGACIRTPYGAEPDANDPNFPTFCDVSGNRVGSTPEWTYYASLITERQMGEGFLYGRLDYNWRDEMFIGNDNDPNKATDLIVPLEETKEGYYHSCTSLFDSST